MKRQFLSSSTFLPKRKLKCQKYRMVLDHLPNDPAMMATKLILDDDVLFMTDEMEGAIEKPLSKIKRWIGYPNTVPAPLIFFSCKGKLHDLYTANRPPTLHTAPMSVCGWGILVTTALKGLDFSKKDFFHPDGTFCNDDTTLRTLAAAQGFDVLKHRGLFLEQMEQSKKKSTVARSKEEADKIIFATVENLTTKYPWLFFPCPNPKRYNPVWAARGHKLKMLLDYGALRKTEFGIVPVPSMLRKYRDMQSENRRPLTELL